MNSRKIVAVVSLSVFLWMFSVLAAELTANLDYSKCTPTELKKHLKLNKGNKKEADINAEGYGVTRALLAAAKKTPYAGVIKILVSEQADVKVRDKDGMTALMLAVRYNPVAAVTKELIKSKVKIGTRNNDGQTAIMIAAKYTKTPEIIEYLLEAGANPAEKDFDGLTALDIARRVENNVAIKELTKNSLFSLNFIVCSVKDIRARIKTGSDINERDQNGATALLLAARDSRNVNIVKELIKSGADLKVTDKAGKNVMDYALETNNTIVEEELVKLGIPNGNKTKPKSEPESVAEASSNKKTDSKKSKPEKPLVTEEKKAAESSGSGPRNNLNSEDAPKQNTDNDNDDGLI